MNLPTKVIGYCRVSTEKQADQGDGLEVQKSQIQSHIDRMGWQDLPLEWVVDSAVSGSTPLADRPEGSDIWNNINSSEILIVSKMDRLTRSVKDAATIIDEFESRSIRMEILNLNGDPVADLTTRMTFYIFAAIAENERLTILARTTAGRDEKKKRGLHAGGRLPWGKKVKIVNGERVIVNDPIKMQHLKEMRIMQREGMNLDQISAEFAKRKFIKGYSKSALSRILSKSQKK